MVGAAIIVECEIGPGGHVAVAVGGRGMVGAGGGCGEGGASEGFEVAVIGFEFSVIRFVGRSFTRGGLEFRRRFISFAAVWGAEIYM